MRVFSVTFESDSMVFAYMDDNDVRANGHVAMQKSLLLSMAHQDYREDYQLLQDLAKRTLVNALQDFNDSDPYQEDDDEDDGKGMGDH